MIDQIDILETIKHRECHIIYHKNHDYIVHDIESGALLVDMKDIELFKTLCNKYHLQHYSLYHLRQKEIVDYLNQTYHKKIIMTCFLAMYTGQIIDISYPQGVDIRLLDDSYIQQVFDHYQIDIGYQYIEERISKQCMWGIFENDVLAGFIGIHNEGSMGMLEVIEDYRRKGYGYLLEAFLINIYIKNGKVPYLEVEENNNISLALQRKLGFVISKNKSYWMEGSYVL